VLQLGRMMALIVLVRREGLSSGALIGCRNVMNVLVDIVVVALKFVAAADSER
jgi:hypothetical protein